MVEGARAQGCRRAKACEAIGVSMRTLERWDKAPDTPDQRRGPKTVPANKLAPDERARLVGIATSAEFRDKPPSKIVPELADQGEYVASEATFYRVLKQENLCAYRGPQRPRAHHRPEPHEATAPNQVWSWDITYLRTAVVGIYFYLYLVMDIYSRKIVGWDVHGRESADLASALVEQACKRENIDGKGLVIHSDNGGPMKGATMLATLQRLGIVPSFSRPSVSDDNPFSEALFRTMKYCPLFPLRPFAAIEEAREWVRHFVEWYNNEHRHSAIKYVTPAQRHRGDDIGILAKRKVVYEMAKAMNPARWSGETRDWAPIAAVRLNPCNEDRRSDIQRVA